MSSEILHMDPFGSQETAPGLRSDWKKVEPGIWLICKVPRTYWVEVGYARGTRKARILPLQTQTVFR